MGAHESQTRTTSGEARRLPDRWTSRPAVVLLVIGVCLLMASLALIAAWHSDPPPKTPPQGAPQSMNLPIPILPSQQLLSPEDAGRTMRTRAGAIAAGADYATLVTQLFPLNIDRAKAVVADASSDQARERLVAAVEANLVPLQQAAGDLNGVTTYRQAVLATRLVSYAADEPIVAGDVQQPAIAASAEAQVWVWTLLTVSHAPAQSVGAQTVSDSSSTVTGAFGMVHLELTWERGAWRIDDSTTLDGPTPLVGGPPTSGAELNADLRGFADWRPKRHS